MPWKVSHHVNERMRFVVRLEAGERMTDLCREYGISRKTGYKFNDRYKRFGPKGLFDDSRKPIHSPSKTREEIIKLVLMTKKERPTWGASKLREYLQVRHKDLCFPSMLTIHTYLDRAGLVKKHRRRPKEAMLAKSKLGSSSEPSELWCADFKGQFLLGNQQYCYPLTITDHYSRFLVSCEALESTKTVPAMYVFEAAFKEFGVPERIRTDNGTPFSSRGLFGLSRLCIFWLKLGIKPERIDPGCPQQNGRHERMHRTLKQSTTRPSGKNFLDQQQRFEDFKYEYNCERPHQALQMKTPAALFRPARKLFPSALPEPDYRLHDFSRPVYPNGHVYLKKPSSSFFLSEALAGEQVGLTEDDDGLWRVSFMKLDLGFFDAKSKIFSPVEQLVL